MRDPSSPPYTRRYSLNRPRKKLTSFQKPTGYLFGGDGCKQFNDTNKIETIARAHQLVMEGYKWMFDEALVTVWSAPNYCYRCGNVAAILEFEENCAQKRFKVFEAAPQDVRSVPAKKAAPDYFL